MQTVVHRDGSLPLTPTSVSAPFDDPARRLAARMIHADTQMGFETLVNATTAGEQRNADVTALAGGGFVIVWEMKVPGRMLPP